MRPERYSYLTNDNDETKETKGTKNCVIKQKLKFEDYKNCLEAIQLKNEKNNSKKIKLMGIVLKKIINNL